MGRLERLREKRYLEVEQYSPSAELLFTWRIRPLGAHELYRYPTLLKELMNSLAPRQGTQDIDPELAAAEALAARGGETGPDLEADQRRFSDLLALSQEVVVGVDTGDGEGWSPVVWVDDLAAEREEGGTLYLHTSTIDRTTLTVMGEQAMSRFDAALARAARFPGGLPGRPVDPGAAGGGDDADQPERPAGDL